MPADVRVRQLQLDIDAWAGTMMTRFDGDLRSVEYLKYDVTNIGYHVRPQPDVLVIGAGGGRDVLSALAFGARSVTAVGTWRSVVLPVASCPLRLSPQHSTLPLLLSVQT